MGEEKTKSFIANFYCPKDSDVEEFLKFNAVKYEQIGKARTYIVFDADAETRATAILGYFTLAISVLEVPNGLSNRKRRELDGLFAKKHNEPIDSFPAILLGQFAKNAFAGNTFTGSMLMDFCFSKILEGQKILGGRIVMLECKDERKLLDFYADYGFSVISDNGGESKLLVLNRTLTEQEIM